MDLENKIRAIENYPIDGIVFRDITTLLKDRDAYREMVNEMAKETSDEVDLVVGIEARGFIVGAAVAYALGCGFVPVRKPGKLPAEKISEDYSLEYGTDKIEIHKDAIEKGQKILIVDDLLATGGTTEAVVKLVEKLGGEVTGINFLIELVELNGRDRLNGYDVKSIVKY